MLSPWYLCVGVVDRGRLKSAQQWDVGVSLVVVWRISFHRASFFCFPGKKESEDIVPSLSLFLLVADSGT